MNLRKRQSWNMIILFCILIYGFTAATILKPETEHSETENRDLASMPAFALDTLLNGEFESDYETYLTDQFIMRDAWIGLKTAVERLLLRSESKDIYFAKDGYLIEKHTGVFTTDTAAQNIRILQQFAQLYGEQFGSGHMTFLVAPNAVDILSDKLPAYASPYDEDTYLEKLAAALPEGTWFDAGAVLREHAAAGEELYYRTDHHWKTAAAFYVYQEWAKRQGFAVPAQEDFEIETVTEEFEGTIQSKLGIPAQADSIELYHPRNDYFYTLQKDGSSELSYRVYDYSALDTKSKYNVFFGGNYALERIRTRAGTGRRILVIKDSYAHCFVPFLIPEFDAVDMLDLRYYNQKLSDLIAAEGYTDVLFLYNAAGFAEDSALVRLCY